jgi:hypothetical protein
MCVAMGLEGKGQSLVGEETAGPSTALRSGRDDNSFVAREIQRDIFPQKELSSRPELRRSVVEGPAVQPSPYKPKFRAVLLSPYRAVQAAENYRVAQAGSDQRRGIKIDG